MIDFCSRIFPQPVIDRPARIIGRRQHTPRMGPYRLEAEPGVLLSRSGQRIDDLLGLPAGDFFTLMVAMVLRSGSAADPGLGIADGDLDRSRSGSWHAGPFAVRIAGNSDPRTWGPRDP